MINATDLPPPPPPPPLSPSPPPPPPCPSSSSPPRPPYPSPRSPPLPLPPSLPRQSRLAAAQRSPSSSPHPAATVDGAASGTRKGWGGGGDRFRENQMEGPSVSCDKNQSRFAVYLDPPARVVCEPDAILAAASDSTSVSGLVSSAWAEYDTLRQLRASFRAKTSTENTFWGSGLVPVSYTHLRAHETEADL
eukprot:281244-Rhodomonas_salina.1